MIKNQYTKNQVSFDRFIHFLKKIKIITIQNVRSDLEVRLRILNHFRSTIGELWIVAFLFSYLALYIHDYIVVKSLMLSSAIAVGYALAWSVNNYYDKEIDKFDEEKSKRNFFTNHRIPKFGIFLILAPVLTFLGIAFGQFGIWGILTLILSIFILWAYSANPFRFKNKAGFDMIIHAIFVHPYPYFITIFLLNFEKSEKDYLIILIFILTSLASQLEQQIRDYDVDIKVEKNTTIFLGKKRAIYLMQFLSILIIFIFIFCTIEKIFPLLIVGLGSLYGIFLIKRLISPENGKNEIHSRIAIILAGIYLLLITIFNFSIFTK